MKLGLIADTHIPGTTKTLWPQIVSAFSEVDGILHAGDLWTVDVIDELAQLAPTHVAKGNGDLELTDKRLKETWQLQFDNVTVGLVHEFPTARRRPAELPNASPRQTVSSTFAKRYRLRTHALR